MAAKVWLYNRDETILNGLPIKNMLRWLGDKPTDREQAYFYGNTRASYVVKVNIYRSKPSHLFPGAKQRARVYVHLDYGGGMRAVVGEEWQSFEVACEYFSKRSYRFRRGIRYAVGGHLSLTY